MQGSGLNAQRTGCVSSSAMIVIRHSLKASGLALLALASTNCQHLSSLQNKPTGRGDNDEAYQKWQRDRTWDQLFQTEEHELRKERREDKRR